MVTNEARERARELGIRVARLEYLDSFLKKAVEDNINPSIAIKIALKGVEIFSGAYGAAAPNGPPLGIDMIANVASVTKPITATMLMMLQEDGLVSLWDRLDDFFPEFTGGHKHEVELWHLLTHSSGLSEEKIDEHKGEFLDELLGTSKPPDGSPGEEWEKAIDNARRANGVAEDEIKREHAFEYLNRMSDLLAPLAYRPREDMAYCSNGYRLIMKICEKLSGENFDDLTRKRIFEPLGMTDSHMVLPREKWNRVLLRADSCRGAGWLNSDEDKVQYSGYNGLKTTVGDLLRFGKMFLNMGHLGDADILSPASVRAMTRDYNAGFPRRFARGRWFESHWGLGWNIRAGKSDDLGFLRPNSTYDHAGFGGARLFADPENELTYASYLVDNNDDNYILYPKITNIIYSALTN